VWGWLTGRLDQVFLGLGLDWSALVLVVGNKNQSCNSVMMIGCQTAEPNKQESTVDDFDRCRQKDNSCIALTVFGTDGRTNTLQRPLPCKAIPNDSEKDTKNLHNAHLVSKGSIFLPIHQPRLIHTYCTFGIHENHHHHPKSFLHNRNHTRTLFQTLNLKNTKNTKTLFVLFCIIRLFGIL
jgi:hypothetical protein